MIGMLSEVPLRASVKIVRIPLIVALAIMAVVLSSVVVEPAYATYACTSNSSDLILAGTPGDDELVIPIELQSDLCFIGWGGSGNDRLWGSLGGDFYFGQGGDDLVVGRSGPDGIYGGRGDDRLWGNDEEDEVFGGGGTDLIVGGNGRDDLRGDSGSDRILGGRGADLLVGGLGSDILDGRRGPDFVLGGADDDKLSGGAQSDQMAGGAGSDNIDGGKGNDLIAPGSLRCSGKRILHYRCTLTPGVAGDEIKCGPGKDTIVKVGQARMEGDCEYTTDDAQRFQNLYSLLYSSSTYLDQLVSACRKPRIESRDRRPCLFPFLQTQGTAPDFVDTEGGLFSGRGRPAH